MKMLWGLGELVGNDEDVRFGILRTSLSQLIPLGNNGARLFLSREKALLTLRLGRAAPMIRMAKAYFCCLLPTVSFTRDLLAYRSRRA
jgi:hypothetical protein